MQQNRLYLIIGALVVAVIVLGAYIWRQETKPKGVEIRLDEGGISVQEN
jgi:RsiW-degrading membrane proteinase PrsW (M82 family)